MSDLIAYALKSISQILKPDELATLLGHQKEFDSLEDVLKLYEGGVELPEGLLKFVRSTTPAETVKELFRTDGERLLKFPVPQVIKGVYFTCNAASFNFWYHFKNNTSILFYLTGLLILQIRG